MRYIANKNGLPAKIELSRRNLEALLDKLDDAKSARTLMKQEEASEGDEWIIVTAVENDSHYSERPAGAVLIPETGEWR